MMLNSNGSFLEVSVKHGVFHMAAQVRLINLVLGYVLVAFIIGLKWYWFKRRKQNGMQ